MEGNYLIVRYKIIKMHFVVGRKNMWTRRKDERTRPVESIRGSYNLGAHIGDDSYNAWFVDFPGAVGNSRSAVWCHHDTSFVIFDVKRT